MNIALIGYGRMGHEIEIIAREKEHQLPLIIDIENQDDLNATNLEQIDVAIEFSNPDAAKDNIIACLNHSVPVVSGTTGWLDHWEEVAGVCEKRNTGLFYASNYSIGVNLLFEINKRLAKLTESIESYKVSIREKHHIHKLDAPSGTAISLAEQIIENNKRFKAWKLDSGGGSSIPVEAVREGEIKGIHHVKYDSPLDVITISHEAKTRKAFAAGAVLAAEFLPGKTGIFGMNDLLKLD